MIGARGDIWRQRAWVWASALAFLAINCIGLLVYRVGYSDRVNTLQLDLRDQAARLDAARADRLRLDDLLRQARINRERVLQLYDDHFSTRRRRLTGITAEVKDLARRSGLVPRALAYPEEQIQQYELVKRSFVFTVDGTYADLRKFVNLLELSDSFLTIENAALSEEHGSRRAAFVPPGAPARPGMPAGQPPIAYPPPSAPGGLRIALTISTLFANRDEPKDALAPLPGANAGAAAPRGKTP